VTRGAPHYDGPGPVLVPRLLARGNRCRGHQAVGGDSAPRPLGARRGGQQHGDCGVAVAKCWRPCAAAPRRRNAARTAGAAEHCDGDACVFDSTLAADILPTHLGQRHKLAEVPALWDLALELRSSSSFQIPYRKLRDGAGLTSFMRIQARYKEGKAAVAEAVVAPVSEAADGTVSGNAETVRPGKEAPATGGGGGPDAASPPPRRFSTDASACLLQRAERFHLKAPTLV